MSEKRAVHRGVSGVGTGEFYMIFCPGCQEIHSVSVPMWTFNGDLDKPTITPSLLVRSGHHVPGHEDQCWCRYDAEHPDDPSGFKCYVCHSFVTDGNIQFLSDCTHALAGQTVPLEPW